MEEFEAILETGGAAAVEIAASAIAQKGGPVVDCPNCSHPLIGPYCAICGQPVNTHRRRLGGLLHEFFKDLISLDSRVLRTARALLFQPGELTRAFTEGRTQRYMPAVRLYLFVSLLFFLVLAFGHIALVQFALTATPISAAEVREQFRDVPRAQKEYISLEGGKQFYYIGTGAVFLTRVGAVKSDMSPAIRKKVVAKLDRSIAQARAERDPWVIQTGLASVKKLAADPAALNGALTAWTPRALFLLLPLFAVLLGMFYWRKRKAFYFVDHLVFSLNLHSFAFVAVLAATALTQVWSSAVVGWLLLASVLLYLLLALRRFYRQNWAWTGLKFVCITAIYTTFFLLPAFGGVIVLSVLYG